MVRWFNKVRVRVALWLAPVIGDRALWVAGLPGIAGGASAPFDKQLAPADIYYAPIGEAFPAVADTPAGNWVLAAASTDITEDGITVATNVQEALVRALGSVAPVKAGIVTKDFALEYACHSMTPERMLLAEGGDPDDATDNGDDISFAVPASPVPQGWAWLVRWDQSSQGDGLNAQYEIKSGVQVGAAGDRFSKSDPRAKAFRIIALYTDANWVVYREGDQAGS